MSTVEVPFSVYQVPNILSACAYRNKGIIKRKVAVNRCFFMVSGLSFGK
jgi:hypothetical protein